MADVIEHVAVLIWTVLSLTAPKAQNAYYALLFPAKDVLEASMSLLTFAPGLLDVLQSATPPTIAYFKRLPTEIKRRWGVHLLVLEKSESKPKIYIGSGTDAIGGLASRIHQYERMDHLPQFVKKATDDGYTITHKGVLCWVPKPTPTQQFTVRALMLAMEATLAIALWAMYSRTKDYGLPNICPWKIETLDYDGCCGHSALYEKIHGEAEGLTPEQIAAKNEAHEAIRKEVKPQQKRESVARTNGLEICLHDMQHRLRQPGLVKCSCHGSTYEIVRRKMLRALVEFRIRGVKTNIPFLASLLTHPTFVEGTCWTTFIDDTPSLFSLIGSQNRAQKLLAYLGDLAVNGSQIKGQIGESKFKGDIVMPVLTDDKGKELDVSEPCKEGWRNIIVEKGPEAFAKAVRANKGCLIMDTTWRDAHQSLLATRVRTVDMINIAKQTSYALSNAWALENWGGATFDVAMRFLYEDPWDRLRKMRKAVPNIPFQMLLRGANGVAYSSLPDNAIYHFCDQAKKAGMDIFRVFDALNDMEQLEVGVKAVLKAGGVAEGTMCYSGDMLNPQKKYNLEYYMGLVEKIVGMGAHILGIKDMAGVLKPRAATLLVGSIRKKYPDLPIHVHTHDSAGTGVASMVACAQAGADAVDAATDSMSGMTSQPSIGAVVASLEGSDHESGLNAHHLRQIDHYWAQVRLLYSPFEAGLTGPDPEVYEHEIPGGQLTNLIFQAAQQGLGSQWAQTKKAYEQANDLLGDIVKVTPTSKVVGDLAQFMVSNNLTYQETIDKADQLDFPSSVLEFFEGLMGQPYGGFPEPLRSKALRDRRKMDKRPGLYLDAMDFDEIRKKLKEQFGGCSETDVASYAMYPKVFEDYKKFTDKFGDLSVLPTKYFLNRPEIGEEFYVELEKGKVLILKLLAIGPLSEQTGQREVFYEMNGEVRQVTVDDKHAAVENKSRPKADATDSSQVGAPMSGVVVEVRVKDGGEVNKGDPIAVLSAMKMEMVISAPHSGKIGSLSAKEGDSVDSQDLICKIVK